MFIPKKNRIATYSYLFKEGVLVCKKDVRMKEHPEVKVSTGDATEVGVPNIEVMMLMKSLKSRNLIRVTFSWQHSYCYLTEDGVKYLRTYLALPEDVLPNTQKKVAARPGARPDEVEGERKGPRGDGAPNFRGGDREYRGREGGFGRGGGN